MTKKLTEEWRSKVKGIFESATANTIFEMPETDDELDITEPEAPADLGMGGDVAPIGDPMGGAEETITITKDALRELLLAVSKEEAEEVEDSDEEIDDLGDEEEDFDDEQSDEFGDEDEIDEAEGDEIDDLGGMDDMGDDDLDGMDGMDDMGGEDDGLEDSEDDALDNEDSEIDSIVNKIFDAAMGGTVTAEQIPEIVGDLEAGAELDTAFPVDGGEELDEPMGDEELDAPVEDGLENEPVV